MSKIQLHQIQDIKDKVILSCWVAGLLLLISVLWIATTPLQANYLLRNVNNVLLNNNDSRRISEYIHVKNRKTEILGYWYQMYNSAEKMFVFTVFQNGILIPLGAIVSTYGEVEEIIPLSAHAVQVFDGLPESILQMYIIRIEESAVLNSIVQITGERQ
ncbi:MAG: hypothetical protein FWD24_05590 [Treponema sp.]|nr:hypothetical protein [Treponema sp.]